MEVKVLGSNSPACYNNRKGQGFLVQEEKQKIVLDFGSGCLDNINAMEDFSEMSIIISHTHVDHYCELFPLAYYAYSLFHLGLLSKKIKIFWPENLLDINQTKLKHLLALLGEEHYFEFIGYDDNSILDLGNMEITFCQNPHSVKTYATKIKTDSQVIVYSSDTGYENNQLESFAYQANLFICEGTFLKGQNNTGNHLFAYQSAQIAKKAEVDQLVLTHFWPMISKNEYLEEAKQIFHNTIVAEEGQILKLERNLK